MIGGLRIEYLVLSFEGGLDILRLGVRLTPKA